MNKTKKKARDSVLDARELYEEWMDGKTPTPTPSRIETPKNQKLVRQKSNFKFYEDYKRDVPSRSSISSAKDNQIQGPPRTLQKAKLARGLSSTKLEKLITVKDFKAVDFERYFRWVMNGNMTDLYLVKDMLFDD